MTLVRDLFQSSPTASVLFRPDGVIQTTNAAFCRVMGYERADLERRNWWNLVEAQSVDAALQPITRLVDGRAAHVDFEARLRGRAGERIWCQMEAAVLAGESGPLIHVCMMDVTSTAEMQADLLRRVAGLEQRLRDDTVRAAEVLRDSEERFRAIFEQAPVGIAISGLDGRITRVNDEFRRILGYDPAESEITWSVLTGEAFEPRDAAVSEAVLCLADGREIAVEWSLSVVRDSRGRPNCVAGYVIDISRRKEDEARLRAYADSLDQSNRDLSDFAQVASHDLQEPLRMVKSYLELLVRRYGTQFDADAREFVGFALDGATRMQGLVAGLLTYSRAGSGAADRAAVHAGSSLDAALANLRVAIDESGGAVTRDPLPMVWADSVQLTQVFQNLVANALKFRSGEAPKVHVTATRRGADWEFRVTDNGIGIDPRASGRVFQLFQRLHGPAKYPGTGIGLAVCKRIVDRHGGSIRVESEPGRGATFLFTLPAADLARAA